MHLRHKLTSTPIYPLLWLFFHRFSPPLLLSPLPSNPLGGWKNKGIHFSEGGDAGNREEHINKLVAKMN